MIGKDKSARLKILATVIAGLGAYLMGYLTRLHFLDTGSSVCDISEGLSCEIVNKSVYAEIWGIPVAILGVLFFLSIPYLLYVKPFKKPWRVVLLASVFSLVFGIYLSLLEHFVINSICLFCETSKVLMIALIGVSAYAVRHEEEKLPAKWIVGAVLLALVVSGVVYRIQKPPEPEKDYTAVAECLTRNGVSMFGAYWCPHCNDQKRAFGAAVSSLSYVECDARGENAEPERCIERDIRSTPTWIQEDEQGEVKRLEGDHSPEDLAGFFGCTE